MDTSTLSLSLAALVGFSATTIDSIAQAPTTVPVHAASADAASAFVLAGITVAGRQQLLIDASHLEPGQLGATWTGVAFRRDAGWADALRGGTSNLEIWFAPASRAAHEASPRFDDNREATAMVLVHAGAVQVPSSPAIDGRANDWSQPNDVITITFATPYLYTLIVPHKCFCWTRSVPFAKTHACVLAVWN